MADASSPNWSIDGEYFENSNCTVACPCIFSAEPPFASTPTEGACEVAFAFHIDSCSFGETRLDGLNAGLIVRTPGPMINGNWQAALYAEKSAPSGEMGPAHDRREFRRVGTPRASRRGRYAVAHVNPAIRRIAFGRYPAIRLLLLDD